MLWSTTRTLAFLKKNAPNEFREIKKKWLEKQDRLGPSSGISAS